LLVNNGLKIETRDGKGRVVEATRSFDVLWEKVIREKPTLVWTADNWVDYLTQFQRADEATKSAILNMFHPPLSAPSVAHLKFSRQSPLQSGWVSFTVLISFINFLPFAPQTLTSITGRCKRPKVVIFGSMNEWVVELDPPTTRGPRALANTRVSPGVGYVLD
jgi:hypothetical protein